MYGAQIEKSAYREHLSVIGDVDVSNNGNVILRVGRTPNGGGSWEQTEYIVLAPDEWAAMVARVEAFRAEQAAGR